VKSSIGALGIANRQNAHSMGIAVRALVELFKLVKREKELHREILTFSIAHDGNFVQIHGWYPIFTGEKLTIHRHEIYTFGLTMGDERLTTYNFTLAVYNYAVDNLLKKIHSVIDKLPADFDFDKSSEATPTQSSEGPLAPPPKVPGPQPTPTDLQPPTPEASAPPGSKNKKKK